MTTETNKARFLNIIESLAEKIKSSRVPYVMRQITIDWENYFAVVKDMENGDEELNSVGSMDSLGDGHNLTLYGVRITPGLAGEVLWPTEDRPSPKQLEEWVLMGDSEVDNA